MKKRKLRKWVKNVLLVITIPPTLILLMLEDITDTKGIIIAYIMLAVVTINWFILFKYGDLADE